MALIGSKTANLKNGHKVILRCAQETDAAGLLEATRAAILDGDGIIAEPDEVTRTQEDEKVGIAALCNDPKRLLLLGDSEGTIVGSIDFRIARGRRLSHWGSFSMTVRPGWRGCGVGNALLASLLAWARSAPEIEKVTLAVRADNHRAIALYKKHGFVQSGCAKDYLKLRDGSYVDDLTMELFVRA